MIENLFSLHFFPQRIEGWADKKAKLLKYISEYDLERSEEQTFESDRLYDGRSYVKAFCEIFSEELQAFGKELGLKVLDVKSAWIVKYSKGDFHPVHNHKSTGFSGILYLDYDDKVHTPSVYVSPFNDPVTDTTSLFTPLVQEGDLVIFPSQVMHFCKPNDSDVPRRILSFDMDVR